ncbi:hypothetical protein J2847_003750 [Azospirillum agricola]|nr:hypothetical protein [Azospirillum agricola]
MRELAAATARPVRTLETEEANRLDDTNDVWRSPYKL